jgi:hypothetical protein
MLRWRCQHLLWVMWAQATAGVTWAGCCAGGGSSTAAAGAAAARTYTEQHLQACVLGQCSSVDVPASMQALHGPSQKLAGA